MSTIHTIVALSTSYAVFRFFRRLGIFGLLLLSFLDSSFLFLPFGNDLLIIALISADRNGLGWIFYVLVSAIGSVLGALMIDVLMRKAGEKGLERVVGEKTLQRLRGRMEEKAGLTIFMATVMPPPFPFTPVVMTAAALQYPRGNLLGIIFGARLVRYSVEAVLAIYFGRRVIAYLNSPIIVYIIYGLIVFAIVGSVLSLLNWMNGPVSGSQPTAE